MTRMPESVRISNARDLTQSVNHLLKRLGAPVNSLHAVPARHFEHLPYRVEDALEFHASMDAAKRVIARSKVSPRVVQARSQIEEAHASLDRRYLDLAHKLLHPILKPFVATHAETLGADETHRQSQRIFDAFEEMIQNHRGQWRDDRLTPYIVHTATVAKYMAERGATSDHIIASLHHDAVEDCNKPIRGFKRYDTDAEHGVSISRIVSLLSKPVIRMDAELDDPFVEDAIVHVGGGKKEVKIVHPESSQYTRLAETAEDKKLRKTANVRSFLNRLQLNRLWNPEAGINVGEPFWNNGRFSDEWVALNIKLCDVLANLQTYEGKLDKEAREKGTLSVTDRRSLIQRMVRERKEFIDMMPVVCPAMFDSLPEEIRTTYSGMEPERESASSESRSPVKSLIQPGYMPEIPVGPARGAIRPTDVNLIPKAKEKRPNLHYVFDASEPDGISKTKIEMLLPKDMAYGRKPILPVDELEGAMDVELALHLSGADPALLDAPRPLVRRVPSLLFPNDPQGFVGFELNLEHIAKEKRHEVLDRIVQNATPAMVAKPLADLGVYHPHLPGMLLNNHKGLRWQFAPQFGSDSVMLHLPHEVFGIKPPDTAPVKKREKFLARQYAAISRQLSQFITRGQLVQADALPVTHPRPSYFRFLITPREGLSMGNRAFLAALHRELKRVKTRMARQKNLLKRINGEKKPSHE